MKRLKIYDRRNSRLKELGFNNYEEYLVSDLWLNIRKRVFIRDQGRCVRCGMKATQVHHLSYVTNALTGNDLSLLKSVCQECHHYIEFYEDGRKTRQVVANLRLSGEYRTDGKYRSRPEIGLAHAKKYKKT